MAQLQQPFDPNAYDPTQGGGGSLPVGELLVVAKTSEVKPSKSGQGGYVQYDLEVVDGEHKGRTGAYRLNLYHSNPQTVEIANRQLSALLHVCGIQRAIQDTAEAHNIPFRVVVQPQKGAEAQEKGYTEIVRVKDQNGNEPGGQAAQQAPAGFGGQQPQPQQQPQQQQPQQQPQQQVPWGQQPQQQPQQQQPQQQAAWTQQQQPPQQGGAAAPWGQQQ